MQQLEIPNNTVLGVNYSGAHDSSIAAVAPNGDVLWAMSLERLSRVKQDGRPPAMLLDLVPWDRVAKVAVSTEAKLTMPPHDPSVLLQHRLTKSRANGLEHGPEFYEFLKKLPVPVEFVCHQLAHAASAFWFSGFDSSLCLTYDGGMHNCPWFGGLYNCDQTTGIKPLDRFSSNDYVKITSFYTFITALLGFTPNKHEGKITGLAAYGQEDKACRALLERWLIEDFFELEETMEWRYVYNLEIPPSLAVRNNLIEKFRREASKFNRETIAWTVQNMAEHHVLDILKKANKQGWKHSNICLAGGLFANVKINQRVVESGFEQLFVAPPMTDDGTAIGAALHIAGICGTRPTKVGRTMLLGHAPEIHEIKTVIANYQLKANTLTNPAEKIAQLIHEGNTVAIVQGRMEFGPRALCNRSILASAGSADINITLNNRLNRTEFMPFAPVSRAEDAVDCYLGIERVSGCAEYMTVTVECTKEMAISCPAVVHIDGTARPQLVTHENNAFMHSVMTHYVAKSGKKALVNTSFNIHEEPIVCSPDDAIRGFFESGIDYLYLDGGWLIKFEDNLLAANKYLQKRIRVPSDKIKMLENFNERQTQIVIQQKKELEQKESEILKTAELIRQRDAHIKTLESPLWRKIRRSILKLIFKTPYPLGVLVQHPPTPLVYATHAPKWGKIPLPKFCILTPSYNQGEFLERTILSVLNQNYPNLRYGVQDGGSTDNSSDIIIKYNSRLTYSDSRPDKGQAAAINYGFSQMRPHADEIMAWLNSDDILLPGALHHVAKYFAENPSVDVIYGHRIIIDERDQEVGRWYLPAHCSEALRWVDFIPQESLFWRNKVWAGVGGLDVDFQFALDWAFLLKIQKSNFKIKRIDRFIGCFRTHKDQKTNREIKTTGRIEMDKLRAKFSPQYINPAKNIQKFAITECRRSALQYRLSKFNQ